MHLGQKRQWHPVQTCTRVHRPALKYIHSHSQACVSLFYAINSTLSHTRRVRVLLASPLHTPSPSFSQAILFLLYPLPFRKTCPTRCLTDTTLCRKDCCTVVRGHEENRSFSPDSETEPFSEERGTETQFLESIRLLLKS